MVSRTCNSEITLQIHAGRPGPHTPTHPLTHTYIYTTEMMDQVRSTRSSRETPAEALGFGRAGGARPREPGGGGPVEGDRLSGTGSSRLMERAAARVVLPFAGAAPLPRPFPVPPPAPRPRPRPRVISFEPPLPAPPLVPLLLAFVLARLDTGRYSSSELLSPTTSGSSLDGADRVGSESPPASASAAAALLFFLAFELFPWA